MRQTALFSDVVGRPPAAAGGAPPAAGRALPMLGEPLGEQKDIRYVAAAARSVLNGPETTGMGYWSINPYVGCAFGCAYCYARYAHRYVMERRAGAGGIADDDDDAPMPPWLAFERRIFVKENAPALVRAALRQRGSDALRGRRHPLLARRETIVVGTATDPYQPAERRFRVTRGVLEALAEHPGLRVVIITKSPLVTRDVDVLARLTSHSSLSVHVSLVTLDRELARRIEPRAPTPEARLRAIARLREAGIEVGVNVMPVLPGITDRPSDLEALVRAVAEAGATFAGACALRLQSEARKRYLPFIEAEFPHLAERYRTAYAHGYHVGERYRAGLGKVFERLCDRYGLRNRWREDEGADADEEGQAEDAADAAAPPPQLSLAL
ncbi:MAG: SPL family radical SAM protein [Gemmatimonadaceae bacterium]